MRDVIPQSEAEFLTFARQFTGAADTYADLLGIPAATVTGLKALLAAYETAYTACESPNAGKLDRLDRKEKREALKHEIRRVKKIYLDADPSGKAADEIRAAFGLPLPDHTRTPVPKPDAVVPFTLEHGDFMQVVILHPARPEGYSGAVAFYRAGGPPPADETELTQSTLLTRPRELLTFPEKQKGDPLYITLCWQNGKGQLGPAGPIQNIILS